MAKYRTVHTSFWSDSKVVDDFNSDDKFLFLYILTNEKSNQLGCYELPISQICRDTKINKSKIEKILKKLEEILKVIVYDYETKEIFIKNWNKYNWLNSSLTKKCVKKEFETLKSVKLKELISPLYGVYIKNEAPTKEEKEEEEEKEKKNKKNRGKEEEKEFSQASSSSITPTLNEIVAYALEKNIDNKKYCEKFYNHYAAIGWVNGTGQIIQDWKLVFDNWIKEDFKKNENTDDSVYEIGSTKGLPKL